MRTQLRFQLEAGFWSKVLIFILRKLSVFNKQTLPFFPAVKRWLKWFQFFHCYVVENFVILQTDKKNSFSFKNWEKCLSRSVDYLNYFTGMNVSYNFCWIFDKGNKIFFNSSCKLISKPCILRWPQESSRKHFFAVFRTVRWSNHCDRLYSLW